MSRTDPPYTREMDLDAIKPLPKAVLHDHLDGGLRPETILDLAEATGYEHLPSNDPAELAKWFDQSDATSLEHYLQAYEHTIALMQTPEALERAAYEAVEDLAADGVVYAELRYAPAQHLREGLTLDEVVLAVERGIRRGAEATGCVAGVLLCAMRQHDDSGKIAQLAITHRNNGVVGFDLAGPEAGYPADSHLAACRAIREASMSLTLHAAEGDGPNSLWRALHRCGAHRIGHGVRIIENTTVANGEIVALGHLAASVRDQRVPLEVSITSNVDIGIYPSSAEHPVGMLHRAGFVITLNTDGRLMSDTTMSREFEIAARHHGFGIDDFRQVTEAALLAGFGPWPQRRRLIEEVVRPAYGR